MLQHTHTHTHTHTRSHTDYGPSGWLILPSRGAGSLSSGSWWTWSSVLLCGHYSPRTEANSPPRSLTLRLSLPLPPSPSLSLLTVHLPAFTQHTLLCASRSLATRPLRPHLLRKLCQFWVFSTTVPRRRVQTLIFDAGGPNLVHAGAAWNMC